VAAGPCEKVGHAALCEQLVQRRTYTTAVGWTPAQLQDAYNLPSSARGKGDVVGVVDAYDNPNAAADLAEYRSYFNLPSANFDKFNQDGERTDYPPANSGWGIDIDQDIEMVSASCPNCTVYLIEANSDGWGDIEAAESEAVKLGADIVSNSYGGSGADQSYYNAKGVEYLGAGGEGYTQPADFDSVVAVGGTVLTKGGGGKRGWTETAWSGAGGGCIEEVPKPSWQRRGPHCNYRQANDVAAVADGVAIYDSYKYGGWFAAGGTAVSTPFLAGVFGLAGNANKQDGGRTFWLPKHQKHLYEVQNNERYLRYSAAAGFGTPDGINAF